MDILGGTDEVAPLPAALGWMKIGEPDSAVVALLRDETRLVFGRAAIFWHPLLDPIRSDPRIQAWLAERGLGGVQVQRTPVDDRVTPMVLRESVEGTGP